RVDVARHAVAQTLGQLQHGLVHDGGVLRVDHLGDLRLRRLDHLRVAMTGAGHADAGGEVEMPTAVGVIQITALAALDEYAGGLLQQRGQVPVMITSHISLQKTASIGGGRSVEVSAAREAIQTDFCCPRTASIHDKEK